MAVLLIFKSRLLIKKENSYCLYEKYFNNIFASIKYDGFGSSTSYSKKRRKNILLVWLMYRYLF